MRVLVCGLVYECFGLCGFWLFAWFVCFLAGDLWAFWVGLAVACLVWFWLGGFGV